MSNKVIFNVLTGQIEIVAAEGEIETQTIIQEPTQEERLKALEEAMLELLGGV